MSNNFMNIDTIPGIQDLDDTTAQNCSGGSYTFTTANSAGEFSTANRYVQSSRESLLDVVAFNVGNITGGNAFTLTYVRANGTPIAVEEVAGGGVPQLYRGFGGVQVGDRRAVADFVDIQQDNTGTTGWDVYNGGLDFLESAMNLGVPVSGSSAIQFLSS